MRVQGAATMDGSSQSSRAGKAARSDRPGDDAVSRTQPLRRQWVFGQESILEMPGQVLQHFCTRQLLSFGGGLTYGHQGLGRRKAGSPSYHTRAVSGSLLSPSRARGSSLGREDGYGARGN